MAIGIQAAISAKAANVTIRNLDSITHSNGYGIGFEDPTLNTSAFEMFNVGSLTGKLSAMYSWGGYRIFLDGVGAITSTSASGVEIWNSYSVFLRNVGTISGNTFGIIVDGGAEHTHMEIRGDSLTVDAATAVSLEDSDATIHNSTLDASGTAILGDNSYIRAFNSTIYGDIDITDGALHLAATILQGGVTALRAVLTVDKVTGSIGSWDLDTCSSMFSGTTFSESITATQTATMAVATEATGSYIASGTAPNALLSIASDFSEISSDTPYFSCVVLGHGSPNVSTSGNGAGVFYCGGFSAGPFSVSASGDGAGLLGMGGSVNLSASSAAQCGMLGLGSNASTTAGTDSCALVVTNVASCSGTASSALIVSGQGSGGNIGNAVCVVRGGGYTISAKAHAQALICANAVIYDIDRLAQAAINSSGNIYFGSTNYVKLQVGHNIQFGYEGGYEVYAEETNYPPEYNALSSHF